jgi:hypothetical protein
MFSFDTPESPGGLYINLSTFQARARQRTRSRAATTSALSRRAR